MAIADDDANFDNYCCCWINTHLWLPNIKYTFLHTTGIKYKNKQNPKKKNNNKFNKTIHTWL